MSRSLPVATLNRHREIAAAGWNVSRSVVLVPSGLPVPIAGTDAFHPFHAHAEHLWLAGTDTPGQVLAFDPAEGFVLFVHVATQEERVWEGAGEDLDAVRARTGIDDVRPREKLRAWLAARADTAVAVIGNREILARSGGYGNPDLAIAPDRALGTRLSGVITAARRAKDEGELTLMRAAATATDAGHRAGMRFAAPGVTERQVQVEIETGFFRAGGDRTAYGTIVGAGPNGAVLHYTPSSRALAAGDLVLVDAGASVGGYMCDVTRTFPADGTFTAEQADLYDLVLAVQETAIAKVRPGKEYREIHLEACVQFAQGLVDFGLLRGDPEGLVERDAHALFFPHGIGHLIGLTTHDVGGYADGRERSDRFGLCWLRTDLPLEAGYAVTIEPGLYFIPALLNDPARRETYRDAVDWARADAMIDFGGIRIEDDVVATDGEPEVLTAATPKARADVEEACR